MGAVVLSPLLLLLGLFVATLLREALRRLCHGAKPDGAKPDRTMM